MRQCCTLSRGDSLPAGKTPIATFLNGPHKVQSGTGIAKPYFVFGTVFLYAVSDTGTIAPLGLADISKAMERGEDRSAIIL